MEQQVSISQIITNYWYLALSFIGGVVWFARLEFKNNFNSDRILALEEKDREIVALKNLVERIDAKLTVLIPDYNGK